MSEPSNALTMTGLMKLVAEKLAVGEYCSTGQLHVPTDPYNFELCKQYIINGIEMFMADAPRKGWRWMRRKASITFATRITGTVDSVSGTAPGAYTLVDAVLAETYDTDDDLKNWWIYILTGTGIGCYAQITGYAKATGTCTVADWLDADGNPISYSGGAVPAANDTYAITSVRTVGGDSARYILSANFGGTVDGPIEYAAGSSRSTPIEWCDESVIRASRSLSVNSGPPMKAAIRPYQPVDESLGQTRLWEIIFDPQPSAADTVEFPYTLYFDSMDMESGSADAGGATYITDTNRWEIADYFNDWICTIVEGTGKGNYGVVIDYDSRNGSITAFATANGGAKTEVASATHGLTDGDVVTISGTTSYNGTYVISSSAAGTFEIEVAFVADDGTGTWKQRQIEVGSWLNSVIAPDSTSKYIIEPVNNLHPAGHQFDDAIKAACLSRTEMESQDEHMDTFWTDYYHKKALRNAHTVDARSAPRKLGKMLNGPSALRGGRSWNDTEFGITRPNY